MLGIGGGRQRMVRPQSPASQILSPAQAVSGGDVAGEGFSSVAAIKTNHIVRTHRLPHRDSRSKCFFAKRLLSKPTEASVHDGDEVRKLTCADFMVSQVTSYDFRSDYMMAIFVFHGSLPGTIFYFVL